MLEKIIQVKEYRKGKFTQKEMSDTLELSERQYRRIEKGVSNPDIWTAIQIADLLGIQDLRLLWRVNQSDT